MRQRSNVYVIGNAGVGAVKVGLTTDLRSRIRTLSRKWLPPGVSSMDLMYLRVYETEYARELEYYIHALYQRYRLSLDGSVGVAMNTHHHGSTEWFVLGDQASRRVDMAVMLWSQKMGHAVTRSVCHD